MESQFIEWKIIGKKGEIFIEKEERKEDLYLLIPEMNYKKAVLFWEDKKSSFEGEIDKLETFYLNEDKSEEVVEFARKCKFPEIEDYWDITENLLLGFKEIDKHYLDDHGVWVGFGKRVFKFKLTKFCEGLENLKLKGTIQLEQVDNDKLEESIQFYGDGIVEEENILIKIEVDTNKFLEIEKLKRDNSVILKGYLGISLDSDQLIEYQNGTIQFQLPFQLKVTNPTVSDQPVAIDFGTSATCIAKNEWELLPLSDNPEREEDYENKTAIAIFNWKKIYTQLVEESHPLFNRRIEGHDFNSEEFNKNFDHFEYSNSTNEMVGIKGDNSKILKTLITELKLLPTKTDESIKIEPLDNFKTVINLSFKQKDEEHLNPIFLYSYLIGRTLNNPINGEVYTNYIFTIPVKFTKDEREILIESLVEGIKKSLPERFREKVYVLDEIFEPVALVGVAIFLEKIEKEELFGIFDFGGGTLDFAVGFYRNRDSDNPDEENYSEIIQILGTGGSRKGGEIIIQQLAYEIYKQNREQMKSKQIPILIPEGMEKIRNYPSNLMNREWTILGKINLWRLMEEISRPFFKNELNEAEDLVVELYNRDGKPVSIEIEPNLMEWENFIKNIIDKQIEAFGQLIVKSVEKYRSELKKYDIDTQKITIFLAGNSSKSRWTNVSEGEDRNRFQEILEDKLENLKNGLKGKKNQFEFKIEIKALEEIDEKNGIIVTRKSGVALGASFLAGGEIGRIVPSKKRPLDRYITDIRGHVKLSQGLFESEWVLLGRVNNGRISIYYSFETNPGRKRNRLFVPGLPQEQGELFGRVFDGPIIECFIKNRDIEGEQFYIDLQKGKVVDLENGKVKKKNLV